MNCMRVSTNDLVAGCILSEDIFRLSNRPIIEKNTILTDELIEILHLFLIPTVEVERTLVVGTPFNAKEVAANEKKEKVQVYSQSKNDFITLFLQAAKEYKKEFQMWQSGMPIDISKIRTIILPLLEITKRNSSEIFSLHHLSNNEEYNDQHAVAVGLLCGYIAGRLNYSNGEVVQSALAGILADCGMAKVNPRILTKKSALTPSEFEEVTNHPKFSYQMVQHESLLKEGAKVAIIQHHERLDGSGYPFGLTNNKMHPLAKIIGVADTYHAMTSERLYRKKQSPFKVLELMRQDYFGKYDIAALKALSTGIMNFTIGSKIRLSNGELGEVFFISEKSPTRPLIKIENTEDILNLEENRHLFIEEII